MINFRFNNSEETLPLFVQMPSRCPGLTLDTDVPTGLHPIEQCTDLVSCLAGQDLLELSHGRPS